MTEDIRVLPDVDAVVAPGFLEAFRSEASLLRTLDVPQVVRLFDHVEAPGQGAAIVMELSPQAAQPMASKASRASRNGMRDSAIRRWRRSHWPCASNGRRPCASNSRAR